MTDQRGGGPGGRSAYGVSDEVWQAIEPEAGRAATGERRALGRVVLVVAALTVGTTALLLSGLVTARLSGGSSAGGGSSEHGQSFLEFTLHNDGVTPVHVVGWKSRLHGLTITGVQPDEVRLLPRASEEVKVSLSVSDCAVAVPAAQLALKKASLTGAGLGVVVDRPWGRMETVVLPVLAVEDLVLSSCKADFGSRG